MAWLLALIFLPLFSVPFYIFFGARKMHGYRKLRRHKKATVLLPSVESGLIPAYKNADIEVESLAALYSKISGIPMLESHDIKIFTQGKEFYSALRDSLESAKGYILLEFYIIQEDSIGEQLRDILIKKAQEGVKVICIYDAIGSNISQSYLNKMRNAGITIEAPEKNSWSRKIQVNFRNHRKIVVVDGLVAFVGGYNIGEEYSSGGKQFGFWRDTHVSFRGSGVQAVQLTFLEDYYACGADVRGMSFLNTKIEPNKQSPASWLHVMPSGPSDSVERAMVMVQSLIHKATQRLWISTPYFVVDETVMAALRVAVLKGVDVRLLIPRKADHLLVKMAAEPLIRSLVQVGGKVYFYEKGFNHQKTWVVDEDLAVIGTLNLDNRSIHLNFELSLIFFSSVVNKRLADDFILDSQGLSPVTLAELNRKPLSYRAMSHVANMFAPLL